MTCIQTSCLLHIGVEMSAVEADGIIVYEDRTQEQAEVLVRERNKGENKAHQQLEPGPADSPGVVSYLLYHRERERVEFYSVRKKGRGWQGSARTRQCVLNIDMLVFQAFEGYFDFFRRRALLSF